MIYPTMVLRLLPTGLLGIMLSALLAALTSTLSAILNSTSTLFTMDFYAKIDKRADERRLVRVGKLASLVIIVIAALWAPRSAVSDRCSNITRRCSLILHLPSWRLS